MNSINNIRCTIIINTYNRAPCLRRLLSGLGHLKGDAFEVVVVNGPSTDGTDNVLEYYQDRIFFECFSLQLPY